ncbi:hypothetical protein [Aureivirga sp. CE67]|uniref:hypothetical protein n=1 Tax=Aureivirga sp. CE67 TaxID=1788983 RepID=UPI0018CAC71F|nr:hypothetical protein [Aureivirga sp. CE67]
MKQIIIILTIFSSLNCFGQKWHLNKVDENEKYPYEYWFQFENLKNTCSYQLFKNFKDQNSLIELFDNQNRKVNSSIIKVINIEKGIETEIYSDFDGKTKFKFERGKYRIKVESYGYDNFTLEFEIKKDEQIKLKIKLGLAPEVEVYQIDSKAKLKEIDIIEIIECVRKNRTENINDCSDWGNYIISMHI